MPKDFGSSFIDMLADAIAARLGEIAPRRGPGRPPGSKNKISKRVRRTLSDLEQMGADLIAHVTKNPGKRMEEIAKALGASTKELVLPARKLISQKKLKTKGRKRATTYFAG
jgi:hypothetical protein